MQILKFTKTMLLQPFFLLVASIPVLANIPSAKGENRLSIGTGITSFLNGSVSTFHPLNNHLGIGIGVSGQYQIIDYYYHYVGLVRFYNSDLFSTCLFYENGRLNGDWNKSKNSSAIGLGFSSAYKENKIDTALSLITNDTSRFGLGTGIKLTKPSGTFYEISFLDKLPTFAVGFTQTFSEALRGNKEMSYESKKQL